MGRLYIIFGKSASGKDTLFRRLVEDRQLDIKRIVPYTTRPIRTGEQEGREYHFVSEAELERLAAGGRVLEKRTYHTVHGDWSYFTVEDGQINWEQGDYILTGTLEVYTSLRDYYGAERVVPLYIEVEDGERLSRALQRERSQTAPKYAEMCRRFLADSEDFSEERLTAAGIGNEHRYENDDFEKCQSRLHRKIMEGKYKTGKCKRDDFLCES